MEIISDHAEGISKKAAKALKDGQLVAFPTETVYGLGADATNKKAVSRIYSVKGRPISHPLIVHIGSQNDLIQWAIDVPDYAWELAKEFWPGPLTLILNRSSIAKDFITGNQDTIGVRVPNHPIIQSILCEFKNLGGLGVAAPSANRFGAVSPTTAEAVAEELQDFLSLKDLIIDSGLCLIGLESTILDCTTNVPQLLRPGALSVRQIQKVIGRRIVNRCIENENRASGSFELHYSPKAKVVLTDKVELGDGFFAMESIPTPVGAIRLASPGTVNEFARQIYAALRAADQMELKRIAVVPPIGGDLGDAIQDRLKKASAQSKNR